jgi:hypothetical protein
MQQRHEDSAPEGWMADGDCASIPFTMSVFQPMSLLTATPARRTPRWPR